MGGIVVVLAVLVAMIVQGDARNVFAGLLVLWFAGIGLLDDFVVPRLRPGTRGLGWHIKLVLQIVPFIGLVLASPGTPIWIIGLTGFVVLFTANAYNFSDGMDGLAGGIGMLLALTLGAVPLLAAWASGRFESYDLSIVPVLFALALALVPFLILNAPPAKVFMGDVGALPIGALLGMGFLQGSVFRDPFTPNIAAMWPLLPVFFVLAVEIIPGPLQIASAKLRKGKRLFPFRTPVHHGFQAAGWPETRVVALFVLIQLLSCAVAASLVVWTEGNLALGGGR
jgi:phospho-N-acetylmuramoyl-pentapeptide-transferase